MPGNYCPVGRTTIQFVFSDSVGRAMCHLVYRVGISIAAAGIAIVTSQTTFAATSPNVTQNSLPSPSGMEPGREGQGQFADSQPSATPEPPSVARITFSRAAAPEGRPVYFFRSVSAGTVGSVAFSSRELPGVFSVGRGSFAKSRVSTMSDLPSGAARGLTGARPSAMPVAARGLTSGFGMRQHPIYGTLRAHSGVDLAASFGSPIVATSDGVVSAAGWAGGYGLLVALEHGGGMQTRYGHMSRLNVASGQAVRQGDVIGYVGSTGVSTGPHLHYEVRVNGQAVNPAGYLRGR